MFTIRIREVIAFGSNNLNGENPSSSSSLLLVFSPSSSSLFLFVFSPSSFWLAVDDRRLSVDRSASGISVTGFDSESVLRARIVRWETDRASSLTVSDVDCFFEYHMIGVLLMR